DLARPRSQGRLGREGHRIRCTSSRRIAGLGSSQWPTHRSLDDLAPPQASSMGSRKSSCTQVRPRRRPGCSRSHRRSSAMSIVKGQITVTDVTRIDRVGTGPIYRAVVSLEVLHDLLKTSTIRYAPRYQRGFKKQSGDIPDAAYDQLLPLTHPDLDIKAA